MNCVTVPFSNMLIFSPVLFVNTSNRQNHLTHLSAVSRTQAITLDNPLFCNCFWPAFSWGISTESTASAGEIRQSLGTPHYMNSFSTASITECHYSPELHTCIQHEQHHFLATTRMKTQHLILQVRHSLQPWDLVSQLIYLPKFCKYVSEGWRSGSQITLIHAWTHVSVRFVLVMSHTYNTMQGAASNLSFKSSMCLILFIVKSKTYGKTYANKPCGTSHNPDPSSYLRRPGWRGQYLSCVFIITLDLYWSKRQSHLQILALTHPTSSAQRQLFVEAVHLTEELISPVLSRFFFSLH